MLDLSTIFDDVRYVKPVSSDTLICVGRPSKTFFKSYIQKYDNDFYEPLSGRIDIDAFTEKINTLSTTFAIVHQDQVAGLIASYFYDIQSKKGFITLVHTKREFRGKHLAREMVLAVQDFAKSIEFNYVDLAVYKENHSAFNLYLNTGFSVLSEENGRCAMRWKRIE